MSSNGCETFVDIWADEVRRLVPEVKRLRAQHDRLDDRGDEGAPTDYDFYDSFRRLWAAQHHLVWAANQLERWTRRLAQERREPEPVPDALLTDLRNVWVPRNLTRPRTSAIAVSRRTSRSP